MFQFREFLSLIQIKPLVSIFSQPHFHGGFAQYPLIYIHMQALSFDDSSGVVSYWTWSFLGMLEGHAILPVLGGFVVGGGGGWWFLVSNL